MREGPGSRQTDKWLNDGDNNTPQISHTHSDQEPCAYTFATTCILNPSVRCTLGWVPLDGDETNEWAEAIRQLVSQPRECVTMNCVYFDYDFYRVHLTLTLEDLDVEI